ncbi:transmembrane anchor protein [Metapseudomonas otitidis]|uniref:transmembrane anchor protein n=1 Tax=Metapseudomonas otitidis TaxID=319939 RepID=UPI002446D03C|nr:transmembrane anchor protein [Pseudomonas otitidis]MDG9782702.1 transmembrane anchor protein [Pseudomonas otitidis]
MFNSKLPTLNELPSSKQLLRSTVIAMVAAGALLVTVVMPSEYALDPTGVGSALGLTQMGKIKIQLAEEAAADAAVDSATLQAAAPVAPAQPAIAATPAPAAAPAAPSAPAKAAGQQHQISITLAPNQGAEVKLEMRKGARVDFTWSVADGVVNYDTHGDPYNAPKGFYHGYGKGRATQEDKGTLEAAFDGKHGWFWRNRGSEPVTVTLKTEGDYLQIKRVI